MVIQADEQTQRTHQRPHAGVRVIAAILIDTSREAAKKLGWFGRFARVTA